MSDREKIIKLMMMKGAGKLYLAKKKERLENIIKQKKKAPNSDNFDPGDTPDNFHGDDLDDLDDPNNNPDENTDENTDENKDSTTSNRHRFQRENDDYSYNLPSKPEVIKREKVKYNKTLGDTNKINEDTSSEDTSSEDTSSEDTKDEDTKDEDITDNVQDNKMKSELESSNKTSTNKKSRTIKRKKIFFHVKDIPMRNKMSKRRYVPNTRIKKRTESFVPFHKEKLSVPKRSTTKKNYKLNDIGEEKLRESRYKFLKNIEL